MRKGVCVRGYLRKLALPLAASAVLVVAGTAGGASQAKDTLVWAIQTDPALLDPSLVSDGPSLQVTDQIFNSLVGFKVGGTSIVPELATSWKAGKNGLAWTFTLRKGVKFQDGTRFNAKAVCTNFQRWFNFPAALQSDALSYYWNTVFQGFAHPAQGNPGPDKALYKGCSTRGQYQAIIHLTRRSSSFLGALGLPGLRPSGAGEPRARQGAVQGVQHTWPVSGHHPPDPTVIVVPRRARSSELWHCEPNGAREVQGQRGYGQLGRRFQPDRDLRDAKPHRDGAIQAQVVVGRKPARTGPEPPVLGKEAKD